MVRTTNSWVCSFDHVAELTSLGPRSRMWLPGPLSATLNLFAATLARHRGVPLVGEPGAATHAHLTPMQLARALDDGRPLDGLRLTVAGDRLDRALRQRAEAAGAVVTHYYGAAELSFVAWGSDEEDLRAFPGVEVAVRDEEIWVRSPYVCERYDGPAGPLRRDADGFATVGDRGSLADGVLTVAGRGDAAVVTGGATVHVADVEQALRASAHGDLVVVGLPHAGLGEVVSVALTDAGDLAAVHAASLELLAPAQRPRQWFLVPALPLTDAGKVDRAALVSRIGADDAVRLVPRRDREGAR